MDAWLARRDANGNQQWMLQIGSGADEICTALAPDNSGGVYAASSVAVCCPTTESAVLARYDGAGNELWSTSFGSGTTTEIRAMVPDGSGGAFATGTTDGTLGGPSSGAIDAWVAHYDGAGNRTWIRQFGTSAHEYTSAMAQDGSGGLYISGITFGSLGAPSAGGADAWIAHCDSSGHQLWMRQFGTSADDGAYAVAPDGYGGLYVGGGTGGSLGGPWQGSGDAWLGHFDSSGNLLWMRQFGTSALDSLNAVASDGSTGVYLCGYTGGNLAGQNAGIDDAWLTHFDTGGNQTGITQFGTSAVDHAWAAAADGSGGVFCAGATVGSLGGPRAGGSDGWVAHFQFPPPSTYCTPKLNSLGCVPSIGWNGSPTTAGAIDNFHVTASNVLNRKPGIMIWGTSAASIPLGGGTLCIAPPVVRTAPQLSGGSLAPILDCSSQYSFHFGHAYVQSYFLATGQTVRAQFWSRDPGYSAPNNIGLTNALAFVLGP